ncbi:MAG TPA: YetF domain-containing protein [Bryobacteraceae bacterium]|jgi:uncharacterized membrane protein YcaP (DUF421 family)|nr:YetF domain-containing protein [Bryobacteraceae bacterium]
MGAVFRAIFGYCFLVLMVRVVGRRPGKQITPFEFVLVFFIGGVTLTPMVGDDKSLSNAFCQIMTIAVLHYAIAWCKQKNPRFGRLVDGTPLVLVDRGQERTETMHKMRISLEDVRAMARDRGLANLDKVDYAVLERNGDITILQSQAEPGEEESTSD